MIVTEEMKKKPGNEETGNEEKVEQEMTREGGRLGALPSTMAC